MTEIDSASQRIRRLVELVAENGLTELTVESDGLKVTILAASAVPEPFPEIHPAAAATPPLMTPAPRPAPSPAAASPAAAKSAGVALESPMVGVFYRSPSPDDPPFVGVGDRVKVGDPIGLIEAMKVFSEVPAEVAGVVVATPVASGQLVHQGQPLLYVEPS